MKIAILTAAPNSYSVKSLVRAIQKRKHEHEIIDPEDLYIYISDKKQGFDRIYQKEVKLQKNSIDAIIPRIGSNLEFGAVTVEHFNKNIGIFSTASASGLLCAQNKMKNQMKLSQAKVRVPKMAFAHRPQDFKFLVDLVGGAGAGPLGIAQEAAGAGVHGRHQHEPGRVGQRGGRPGDGDLALFQGLP